MLATTWYYKIIFKSYKVLLSTPSYYIRLLRNAWYYSVLQGTTRCYAVLIHKTRYHSITQGTTRETSQYYKVCLPACLRASPHVCACLSVCTSLFVYISTISHIMALCWRLLVHRFRWKYWPRLARSSHRALRTPSKCLVSLSLSYRMSIFDDFSITRRLTAHLGHYFMSTHFPLLCSQDLV